MYPSYDKYIEMKSNGLRSEANKIATLVVNQYNDDPSVEFMQHLCEQSNGYKINHIYWKGIVFPYLKGRISTDVGAIKCLIKTIQNLYSDKKNHKALHWITEEQLIRRLLDLDVNNAGGN